MKWKLSNGNVITNNSILENASIIINDDVIESVKRDNDDEYLYETVLDVKGGFILPGFIDLHCHGGKGSDIMDSSQESIKTISRFHAGGGTAYYLATTASDLTENLINILELVRKYKKSNVIDGAAVLGVHLEGPYFAVKKHGCHLPQYVRNPSEEECEQFIEYRDIVKSITVAPEIPGAAYLIKRFSENNIVVSLGHSECSYDEAVRAINLGASHVTHLFCAMSGIVKRGIERSGGLIETALLEDALTAEIIGDGIHVPPELIKLAVKSKGIDRVCIVTDAMRGAGMQDGLYTFGSIHGRQAIVSGKKAVVKDGGGLASSVFRMNELFGYLFDELNFNYLELAKMFSFNPACILSLQNRIGSIEPGKKASFTILDSRHCVIATIVEGKIIYLKEDD